MEADAEGLHPDDFHTAAIQARMSVLGEARSGDPVLETAVDLERLATGRETTVTLSHPLPVHLLCWTVFQDATGDVCFREDVYGRDRRLIETLNKRPD